MSLGRQRGHSKEKGRKRGGKLSFKMTYTNMKEKQKGSWVNSQGSSAKEKRT